MQNTEQLKKEIEALKILLKSKDEEITKLEKLNNWYHEQLKLSRQKRFGKSSEKCEYDYEQLSLFNEAESKQNPLTPELTEETISYAQVKKKEAEENFIDYAISTYDRVAKYCDATLKKTDKIIDANKDFFAQLSNIDEVIIIGHSFGKVDIPYFKKVLNSISENATWTAYYYEEKDQTNFETALLDLGVKKENISVQKTEKLFLTKETKKATSKAEQKHSEAC